MGLFSRFFKLDNHERQLIWRMFGSFKANSLLTNNASYLEQGYEKNVDVYAVIRKIVDLTNDVPYIVERKTPEGWELFEDNTISPLMENPNPGKNYTWKDIDEMILVYLLVNGNSYMVSESGIGSNIIDEVDILPSPFVQVQTKDDFFMPMAKYVFELNQQKRIFEPEEVEHIKLFNPAYTNVQDSFDGLSAIQVAAKVVQVGNDRWDAHGSLLQNRGALVIITDKSNRPMTPNETDLAQKRLDDRISGPVQNGKTIMTNKDLNFIKLGMSATDLQLVESNVVTLRSICNVFGISSSLFNDPESRRNSNRKEDEKALYTNAIIPIAERLAAKHSGYIAQNHYPMGDVRIRKDFSEIEALQGDQKMEAEKDKTVLEGMQIVLSMPIDQESKIKLLQETYDISEELAQSIVITETPNENEGTI